MLLNCLLFALARQVQRSRSVTGFGYDKLVRRQRLQSSLLPRPAIHRAGYHVPATVHVRQVPAKDWRSRRQSQL